MITLWNGIFVKVVVAQIIITTQRFTFTAIFGCFIAPRLKAKALFFQEAALFL